MVPRPIAVPPDEDDAVVEHEAADQGRRHNLVAEDLAPLLEALVRGEPGRFDRDRISRCRYGRWRGAAREAGAITALIVMGVHLNRYVLGRPYGIRKLVYWCRRSVLGRGLTDSLHQRPHHVARGSLQE
jgi:hypothetical protein